MEENKKVAMEKTRYIKDTAVAELLSQGFGDKVEMLKFLNQSGISMTAKELDESIKALAAESPQKDAEKLVGESQNYVSLSKMGLLPTSISSLPQEQQLGAYLNWIESIQKSKSASASGKTPEGVMTSDQFTKEQIALAAIPTQLRNSDTELKRYLEGIRLGLKEGKTPYQISDELIGYKITLPNEFSDTMRQYISLANFGNSEIGNMARMINAGNEVGAMTLVENKLLQNQKTLDPDGYVGESTARYYAEKVQEIKNEIDNAGLTDKIGPIEGTLSNVFGKLSPREAQKIRSKVTSLVSEMRNHLAGTAVTESEKKYLEPLIASLSDKKGVFINKIDEIQNNSITKHNTVRESAGLPTVDVATLLNKEARVSKYTSGAPSFGNEIDTNIEKQNPLGIDVGGGTSDPLNLGL